MPPVSRTPRVVRANGDQRRSFVPYGWFSFRRVNELVPFKGLLALDFLTVVVLDPRVFHISKKVRALPWWDGARWREHWPRYAIHRRDHDGSCSSSYVDLIDPKDRESDASLFNLVKTEATFREIEYNFFGAASIIRFPFLTNARIIQSRADRRLANKSQIADIRSRFASNEITFTLDDAMRTCGLSYEDAYTAVLHLVAHGELSFDLDLEFDRHSTLWWRPA